MATESTDLPIPSAPDAAASPSVLVVLVVRNGGGWLRDSLAGIAGQTYDRLGVIAVDCASTDGSGDLLVQALDEERVIRLAEDAGLSGAVQVVLEDDRAREADYILTVHDDSALAPDAVARLVEASEGIDVEDVGIVGSKVVDWDQPRALVDVGSSSDRFGHPYSPLEPHELDHGQHDRVREVLWVSSAAMLVSRTAWVRIGLPDERLGSSSEDLDFCWRARIAGLRVLWTPLAVVRHVGASAKDLRTGESRRPHRRYDEERAAVAAILKNYRLVSLLWIVPLYALQGSAKVLGLILSRRFDEIRQVVGAWLWNVFHFFGTVRRRRRVQRVRRVRDRQVHRYMVPGSIRVRRWLEALGRIVPGDVDVPDDEDEREAVVPLRTMASSAVRTHPVATAWIVALVVGYFASRHLWGTGPLTGGAVPAMPDAAGDLFREFIAGVRTTALGGAQAASPALALLGSISWTAFGNPDLAERLFLAALPPIAAISMYRFLVRTTTRRVPALLGAGLYALSAVAMWGFSEGRIDFLVGFAVLPRLADRIGVALGPGTPKRRFRFMVGTGVFLAVGLAFWPGIVLAAAVLVVVYLIAPEQRRRRAPGIGLIIGVLVAGSALVFPVVVDLVQGGAVGLGSRVGEPVISDLIRLVLGPATGDWQVAWLLPGLALAGFAVADRAHRHAALRFALIALVGLALSWGSAAGWVPQQVANVPAYLSLVALAYAALVAVGLVSILGRMRGSSWGLRRLLAAALILGAAVALSLQSLLAAFGGWAVGDHELPVAWPIVARDTPPGYRVLWLSGQRGASFPAPGGDPSGVAPNGDATLWYSITDREGVSALDIGRNEQGPGYDYLQDVLAELQAGSTTHVGALLAPLGVRYVVAGEGSLPASVRDRMASQADLDRQPAGGLEVYRNAGAIPDAAVVTDEVFSQVRGSGDLSAVTAVNVAEVDRLTPAGIGWDGKTAAGSDVWIGDQYAPGWRVTAGGQSRPLERSFGWALAAGVSGEGMIAVRFEDQWLRTAETAGLVLLWLAAVWITRKPARR